MERRAIYSTADNIEDGQEWDFSDADTREHLHSLHPYPAKFIPQIPRVAIKRWSKPGDIVYDPFCGCGTALLEASLLGRPSIGVDNNAVAILVSRAKTATYKGTHVGLLKNFGQTIATLDPKAPPRIDLVPDNENFQYWFSKAVIARLSTIKGLILEQPEPIRTLLLAIFSSVIVRVSYQDSDTRYARTERVVEPQDVDGAVLSKLRDVIGRIGEGSIPRRANVTLHQADARHTPFISSESVSLIVTSPPYLNAYDYHKYHRQRIHWISGDVAFARDVEIGKHDDFTRPGATPDQYFVDMGACFSEWQRVLKPGGKCLVLIGDAIVSKAPVYVADQFISLMKSRGMQSTRHWIRRVPTTRKTFNGGARINREHVLLFKKHG
jgi:site-specific DNA-methyltransferase (cytosine-N4-specific)